MLTLLAQAVQQNLLRSLDLQLAKQFAGTNDAFLLVAIAWLSAEVGVGHVCLPLTVLTRENLFNGRQPELAQQIWQKLGSPKVDDWQTALEHSSLFSDGSQITPFVLADGRLYLQRMWSAEGRVAHYFNQRRPVAIPDIARIKQTLTQLFGHQSLDWQKIAAALAATEQNIIISGGPGTGKTTTVAKLLATLILLTPQQKIRIALAAPTGKAAARLTESLSTVVNALPLTPQQKSLIPTEAATLHRLLGVKQYYNTLTYHRDNPLHLDVLVVDEASMIDLPMMARLIDALPFHARFILLGDRDQLASVEAGAVLGDICQYAEQGYSAEKTALLNLITDNELSPSTLVNPLQVQDCLCLLRKSYRFDQQSGIGQLAQAIKQGETNQMMHCLSNETSDLVWYNGEQPASYQQIIACCVAEYRHYLMLMSQPEAMAVLTEFNKVQLLCALRQGPFGVVGLNQAIEQALIQQKLISPANAVQAGWYIGRPVMVTRNDPSLGLFNGDIGIALANKQGEMRVYFQLAEGQIHAVQPHRLPDCETAFAMTVHKSQGSEFDHTILVLPDHPTALLTRELVYTAVTRARHKLTLFSQASILAKAINSPTKRQSGLLTRLH